MRIIKEKCTRRTKAEEMSIMDILNKNREKINKPQIGKRGSKRAVSYR